MRRRHLAILSATVLLLGACSSSSRAPTLEVPRAVWSSTGPETATPRGAATAAMQTLFDVTPVLGDYRAGDRRSGEIEVLSPEGTTPVVRSTLLMRQMGPGDAWSVLGAINPMITIAEPPFDPPLRRGMVTVSGSARGFEGTVIVTVYRIRDTIEILDRRITQAGSLAQPEPFHVVMDLRDTREGDVVGILVRGDVGREGDPGEFSAIALRIVE